MSKRRYEEYWGYGAELLADDPILGNVTLVSEYYRDDETPEQTEARFDALDALAARLKLVEISEP